MKTKDYFHFYVGCQYQWQDGDGEWRKAQPLTAYQLSDVYRYHINARLILRPLSDITEAEVADLDRCGSEGWRLINPEGRISQDVHLGVVHRQSFEVRFLLSRGFDLFGLITAGLAIDKTKL